MTPYGIAVLIGSLRRDSYNRKMAHALMAIAPASLRLAIIEIGGLPLYNPDLDETPPEPWVAFRRSIRAADGVLFLTPEYNRSVPAVLKNALDVGSRPYGQSVWSGKPGAVLTLVPGALGGFGANHHLRQSLVFLDVPTLQQPEAYIGNNEALFDAEGRFVGDGARAFVQKFIQAYADWVATLLGQK